MIANDYPDAHYLKADLLLISALLRVVARARRAGLSIWSEAL
jgi:hypothetical protein